MNKKDNVNLITKKNIRYDIDKIIDKLNTKYENIKEAYNIIVPKVKQTTNLKSLFYENNKKNYPTDRNICKLTMNINNNVMNKTEKEKEKDENKKNYNENINSLENQTIRSISNNLLNKQFFLYNSPKKKDLKGRDIYSDFENFIYSSVAKSTKKCVSPKKIQYLFSDKDFSNNSIHETVRNMKRQNNLTKRVYIERDELDIIYDNFIEELKESGLSKIIKQEQFKSNNKNLLIKNRKLSSLRNYIFNDCNSYSLRKKNENDSFNNITLNSLNRNNLDRNFLKELDKKTEKNEGSINKIDDPSITYFNKYFTINNTGGVIRKKMPINIKKSYSHLLKLSHSKSKKKVNSHSNDKHLKTEKKRKAHLKNNSNDISYLIENIKKKHRKINLSLSLYSFNNSNNNNNNSKLKSVKFSNDQQFTIKNTSITSIKSIIKNKTETKLKNIISSPPKKKLNINIIDNNDKIKSIKNSIISSNSISLFKNKNKKLTLNNLQSISSNFNSIKDRIDLINNTLNLQNEIDDDLNKFKKFELIKVNDPGVILFKRDKQKLYMPNLMNKTASSLSSSSANNMLDNKLFTNMIIKSELATKLNSNSTIKFSNFLKKTFTYNEEKRKEDEFKKVVDLSNSLINKIDTNSYSISKIIKKIKKVEED